MTTSTTPTVTALVTGANRGLGWATARQLAERGMRTIVGSRDLDQGERAAEALRADGLDAVAVPIDVDSDDSVRAAAAWVTERFGGLDVLVNNAGILPEATAEGASSPVDVALFRRTFETNLFGAVRTIEAFGPLLRRAPAGRVVNVSSTMGSLSDQASPESTYAGLGVPAYRASKAALNSVTIIVAQLLADTPVKVTSVCPGWVQTDLGGPDNRAAAPLTAADAARVVVEAASLPDEAPSGQFTSSTGPVPW